MSIRRGITLFSLAILSLGWPNYIQEIIIGLIIIVAVALDQVRYRRAS